MGASCDPGVGRPAWQDLGWPCVLVADDDPMHLLITSQMLARLEIRALLAGDGAEAVALALGVKVDLILMDLQMPLLDGFAATRQIRRHEEEAGSARVPVVAYTSTANVDAGRMHEDGFDAVLAKPCLLQEMHDTLARWCVAFNGRGPRSVQ